MKELEVDVLGTRSIRANEWKVDLGLRSGRKLNIVFTTEAGRGHI